MERNSKKILIVFGTRPEVIKLAPVIKALEDEGLRYSMLIVNTNQHSELLEEHVRFWNLEIDFTFQINRTDYNLTSLLTQSLDQLQNVVDKHPKLEYLITQGDTNTALTCAHISYFNKLKLLHIESGLRTNELYSPFPEEFNRVVASLVAHHHFAPTKQNQENLLSLGVEPNSISVVGNTIVDALKYAKEQIGNKKIQVKDRVLITMHRRENSILDYENLVRNIRILKLHLPHLSFNWISHPSNFELINSLTDAYPEIEVLNHLNYLDFIKLYDYCPLVITDSGGVTEEAVQLGIPIIVYREHTERIEPINTGYPFLVSKDEQDILDFSIENTSKTFTPGEFYNGKETSKHIALWIKNKFQITPSTPL